MEWRRLEQLKTVATPMKAKRSPKQPITECRARQATANPESQKQKGPGQNEKNRKGVAKTEPVKVWATRMASFKVRKTSHN